VDRNTYYLNLDLDRDITYEQGAWTIAKVGRWLWQGRIYYRNGSMRYQEINCWGFSKKSIRHKIAKQLNKWRKEDHRFNSTRQHGK
jgi:hypothetical protein